MKKSTVKKLFRALFQLIGFLFSLLFKLVRAIFSYFKSRRVRSEKENSRKLTVTVSHTGPAQWVDHYERAEEYRKDGNVEDAERNYLKALRAGEESDEWKRSGAPPAHYREYAKMLYHCGDDQKAVAVLDRYADYQREHGHDETNLSGLRERLASGDFRRLRSKYNSPGDSDDEEPAEANDQGLNELPGVGPGRAENLRSAGFETIDDIKQASIEDLTEVSGVGSKTAEKILDGANAEDDEEKAPSRRPSLDPVQKAAIRTLPGVGQKTIDSMVQAGFDSIESIHSVDPSELTDVSGIGTATAEKLKEAVKDNGGTAQGFYPFADAVGIPAERVETGGDRVSFETTNGHRGLVEEVALAELKEDGWEGIWANNQPWWAIGAYLYWDVIFAQIEGTYSPQLPFPSAHQDMPQDLFDAAFYSRRESLFAARSEELKRSNLKEELARAGNSHPATHCRLIDPENVTGDLLLQLVDRTADPLVLAICDRIFQDVRRHRRGLPDLFLWNDTESRFAEVKSENDSLGDHQREWLDFLDEQGSRPMLVMVG